MSEQYSIYLQRRKLGLVGTLWLNNTRGHISSAFTVNTALEVAEFFRLRASEAKERLFEIRKAVSYWREEALRVNARSVEIAVMKETYEYCL